MERTTTATLIAIVSALALSACGGGGGGGEPAAQGPKAEGIYVGRITGSSSRDFELLVLENDEYWAMYGTSIGTAFAINGFVQGSGISNNGNFTSSNLRDYGTSPVSSATLTATYSAANGTISGAGTYSGGTAVTFDGTRPTNSTYDYNAPATLSQITGRWSARLLDGSSAPITINSNGSFSGSSNGCTFTGTLTPRASGKNVFNLALTFGGSPCLFPGQAGSGIALTYLLQNSTRRQLIAVGTTSDRSAGTALFGTR